MIQSTVADSLSYGLTGLQRDRDSLGLQMRIVLAIHDAVLLMLPMEEASIAEKLLTKNLSTELEVPGTGLHYDLGLEYNIRWGVDLTESEEELINEFKAKSA